MTARAPEQVTLPRGIDAGAAPSPTTFDSGTADAFSLINDYLQSWGLGGLTDWAWQQLITGRDIDGILLDLRQQPVYQQRFYGNTIRLENGLAPISEAEYLANEQAYAGILRNAGLPRGFYDSPDDFANTIGFDVSPQEYQGRVDSARALIAPNVADIRSEFATYYGAAPTEGAILAYALDPERGLDILQRQVQAASTGAAAAAAGLELTRQRAEQLAPVIGNQTQAMSGFSQVAQELQTERYQAGAQEAALTQTEAENAVLLGDEGARKRAQKRAQEAAAGFQGGGGVAAGRGGVSGLGEASRT